MKTKLFGFKAFAIIATALSVIGFTSCDKEDNTDNTLPALNIISPATGEVDNNLSMTAAAEGGQLTFAVQSNRSWEVTSNADWATVSTAKGSNNGTVTVTVAANEGGFRVANITVKSSTQTRTVAIQQSGNGGGGEEGDMTIAEFRAAYHDAAANSSTADDKENPYIELPEQVVLVGTVVSDNAGGNVQDFLLMMQDGTAENSGICISTSKNHGFVAGDKIIVTCEAGRKVKIYSGLMQLEATSIQKLGSETPKAAEISISEIGKYESQLVTISGVQTKSDSYEKWNGGKGSDSYNGVTFENEEGETVIAYVKAGSALADQKPLSGNGSLTGIASCYYTTMQIQPRNASDVAALTGERFTKEVPTDGKNIILKEDCGSAEVSANTDIAKFTAWSKEGLGAAAVTYSNPQGKVSVRKTGTASGYEGVSGGNNVFFGTEDPVFVISGINLGGAKNLKLGMGCNQTDENLKISYSTDGESTWQAVAFTKKSTAWDYLLASVVLTDAAAEMSIKFEAVAGAQVRIDDITLSTDDEVKIVEIVKPKVTTAAPEADYTSIKCSGSFTVDNAAADVTEVGFYLDGTKTALDATSAEFTYTWTGLEEASSHTVQAYVVCDGTIYKGEELSVATLSQEPAKVLTVSELVAMWDAAEAGSAVGINKQVSGVVTFRADDSNQNFAYSVIILSDNNGEKNSAIMFYGTAEDALIKNSGFKQGDRVIISLDNATFGSNNGLRQIQGVKSADLVKVESSDNAINVKTVTIADVMTNAYQGVSIAIDGVEPETAGTVSSNPKFTDGTASIATYTRGAWAYAAKSYSKVKGTLKGVGNIYKETIQVTPLSFSDIADYMLPELKVENVVLDAEASSTATLKVTTEEGVAWTAATTGSGFTLSATSGTGSAEITVTAAAAGGTEAKDLGTVVVTLTATPSVTATATVKQKAQSAAGGSVVVWEDKFTGLKSGSTALAGLNGSSADFTDSYSALSFIYPGDDCIKIGKASAGGSITTPALSKIPEGQTRTLTITFYADGWNKKECVLTVTANNAGEASAAQTIKSETTAAGNSPVLSKNNQYTFIVTGATSATTITFATGNTAAMFGDLVIEAE